MAKTISISAEVETTAVSVAVTAAPGSAGIAVAYALPSSSVMITNTSGSTDVQYQVGAAAWKALERNSGIALQINMSTETLKLRRAVWEGGTCSAELVIDSIPLVRAGNSSVATMVTTGGGNAVGISTGSRTRRLGVDSTKGAQKWFGNTIAGVTFNNAFTSGSAYRATYGLTMVAEAPFYAVQLVYVNMCNNAITGLRAIVGVTETIATNVAANNCKPVIGGTVYGTLAAAGSVLGFRPATWAGAATMSCGSSTVSQQFAVSDIIPLNSVDRVDVPGALPAFTMRLDHDPATGGRFGFVNTPASMRTATAENRGRILQTYGYGADAVTNPNINITFSGEMHLIFPIFHYAVPSMTVAVCGDSNTQNDSLTTSVFTSWGYRGCADASTPKRPINYLNLGASGKGSTEYIARLQEIVAAGVTIDTLVIAAPSPNDGYVIGTITRLFSDHRSRAMEIVRYCRANNIPNLIWIPLLPLGTLTAAQDAYRVAFNAWLTTIPGTTTLDFSVLGDGASPEQWNPAYLYTTDGLKLHLNEFAIETVCAPKLTAALNAIA
ncbi:SGNH/GDSL hydrolase family protein [Massilia sp. P8910]|uniref:SGNH/GDSL hydrolase family protein n=1 Tax=Massilia antarctica TaxID=2765360 RepID=UPI001E556D8A|nr:SGNH/GDSL hydrolase family protein [Massilia antarctica]MCE3605826.1 SGNH/GDSL hydrolase family protein [Massilia antarctica]